MDPQQVSLSISTTDEVPSFLQKRLGELEDETCIIQIGTHIHKINISDESKVKRTCNIFNRGCNKKQFRTCKKITRGLQLQK